MKHRTKRFDLCIVAVALLLSLIAAEIGLAVFAPQSVARLGQVGPGMLAHPPDMYVEDDALGYALRPQFSAVFVRPEYATPVNINALGMRGPELRPRRENTLRILALGDSFTWGYGATEQEAWPYLLERALANRYPTNDIQVLNAGVPGYGTDEALIFLKQRGAALKPDIVITMFFAGNDFVDNMSLARDTHTVENGMLVDLHARRRALQRPSWERANDWLKARSELVSLTSNAFGYLSMRLGLHAWLTDASSEHYSDAQAAVTTTLLHRIVRTTYELNAQHLLVFVPEKTQVLAGGSKPLRAVEIMQNVARDTATPWLNLTPVLSHPEYRTRAYYVSDGHWSPTGNALAAREIEQTLINTKLLQRD